MGRRPTAGLRLFQKLPRNRFGFKAGGLLIPKVGAFFLPKGLWGGSLHAIGFKARDVGRLRSRRTDPEIPAGRPNPPQNRSGAGWRVQGGLLGYRLHCKFRPTQTSSWPQAGDGPGRRPNRATAIEPQCSRAPGALPDGDWSQELGGAGCQCRCRGLGQGLIIIMIRLSRRDRGISSFTHASKHRHTNENASPRVRGGPAPGGLSLGRPRPRALE